MAETLDIAARSAGPEARIERLRRLAEVTDRPARPSGLKAAGAALLGLYWAVCAAVIAFGVWEVAGPTPRHDPPAPPLAKQPDHPFPGCHSARAAGFTNIPIGSPAYDPSQDGDDDGLACEPVG